MWLIFFILLSEIHIFIFTMKVHTCSEIEFIFILFIPTPEPATTSIVTCDVRTWCT